MIINVGQSSITPKQIEEIQDIVDTQAIGLPFQLTITSDDRLTGGDSYVSTEYRYMKEIQTAIDDTQEFEYSFLISFESGDRDDYDNLCEVNINNKVRPKQMWFKFLEEIKTDLNVLITPLGGGLAPYVEETAI